MLVTYCTIADLVTRFTENEIIQLSDPDNNGVIGIDVVNLAITDATNKINSYLSAYQLPLSSIPGVLVRICCDLARYYLYGARMTDVVQKQYDESVKYLTSVAKNEISLGLDVAGAALAVSGELSVSFKSADSYFGIDKF